MRIFRTSLCSTLLLSLAFTYASGQASQDGDAKDRAQIQAAIKTARAYIESGKRSNAERLLKDIVLVYSKHPATEEARKLLSSLSSSGGAPGTGKAPHRSAPDLLAALRTAGANARTLQLKFSLDCPAPDLPFTGSGELKVSGTLKWNVSFDAKNQAGKTGRMEAWSDGRTIFAKGFQGPSPRPSSRPAPLVRQLREYGSLSFLPLFYGILYQKLDESQDYAATTSDVKDLGRETLQGSPTRKLEYTVTYPTGKAIRVVAWVDENRLVPVKRETHFGGPAPLTETLSSYSKGGVIPESAFSPPK